MEEHPDCPILMQEDSCTYNTSNEVMLSRYGPAVSHYYTSYFESQHAIAARITHDHGQ